MPLDQRLRDAILTYPCPHCGHKTERTGKWFSRQHKFRCPSCDKVVPMGYSEKLKLFDEHAKRKPED
jgi:transposase-like protein